MFGSFEVRGDIMDFNSSTKKYLNFYRSTQAGKISTEHFSSLSSKALFEVFHFFKELLIDLQEKSINQEALDSQKRQLLESLLPQINSEDLIENLLVVLVVIESRQDVKRDGEVWNQQFSANQRANLSAFIGDLPIKINKLHHNLEAFLGSNRRFSSNTVSASAF